MADISGRVVGGIVGENIYFTLTMEGCLNVGNIHPLETDNNSEDEDAFGGIIGAMVNTDGSSVINNCINAGYINSKGIATRAGTGGIAGFLLGSITNCTNTGVVEGENNVGCIVGKKVGGSTVTNCHYDRQMCGE
jgi:hypothetical protein